MTETYRIHTIITTRYAVMKITNDGAEIVKFKDEKGQDKIHFTDERDARLALEKLTGQDKP